MKNLLWTFALLLIMSCKHQSVNDEFKTYDIREGIEKNDKIYLSSIAEDIQYIPLETTRESIIGAIRDIHFKDNFVLIRDDQNRLILFDTDGKFLRTIGKKGNGPDEYVNASAVRFSKSGNEIILLDRTYVRLYDVNSGEAVKVAKIDFYPSAFEVYNNTTMAFYCCSSTFPFSGKYYHIFLMNDNLELIDSLYHKINFGDLNLAEMTRSFVSLYKKNNHLYFWDSFSDTIIYLDEKRNVQKGYAFSFEPYRMPVSKRGNINFWMSREKNNYFYIDKITETDNYFFINGIFQNTYSRNILFNKRLNTSRNVIFNLDLQDWGFHNDLDGSIPFWPKGVAGSNLLYDYASPFRLRELMGNAYFEHIPVKNQNKHEEITAILNRSRMTDNPIIFLVKLREK